MRSVDPAHGVIRVVHTVIVPVLLRKLKAQLVYPLKAELVRRIHTILKLRKGRLLHKGLEHTEQVHAHQVFKLVIGEAVLHRGQAEILHGLREALGKVHRLIGVIVHICVDIVPELMADAYYILAVAVGIDEQERRFIVLKIGLEGHIRLIVAQLHVPELIGLHKVKGFGNVPAHVLRRALEQPFKLSVGDVLIAE